MNEAWSQSPPVSSCTLLVTVVTVNFLGYFATIDLCLTYLSAIIRYYFFKIF